MSYYDPSQPSQSHGQPSHTRVQAEWQTMPQPSIQSPRPPSKKARGRLRIMLGVIVLLVVVLGVVAFGHSSTPHQQAKSKPPVTATHRSQATRVVVTPTPEPTPVIQAIGKAVVVDSTWTVTVNGAKTSQGDPFSTPGAGHVYLVVDVTVKNTSSHYQYLLSGNQCVLKDSTGQSYREAITDFATPPDGYLKFGETERGQLAYEVPATQHTFYFFFQADTNGTDLTEWALHV